MEDERAVEKGFLEANGTRFYYEMAGNGEPVLLIHGYQLDTRMWDDQFEAFAAKYRVIRFDIRGFGQTAATNEPFSLHEDTRAVLEGLGVEKAHVVGLSFGGMVAQEFALEHPRMVRSLTLVSSGLAGHPRTEQRRRDSEQFNSIRQTGTCEEAIEKMVQMWFDGPEFPPNDNAAEARLRFRRMNEHAFTLPEYAEELEIVPPSPRDRLEEIKVPALIIAGERDYADFLQIADELAARMEQAQKIILTDSAHIPPMDQPEVFNQLVLEFWERVEAQPG